MNNMSIYIINMVSGVNYELKSSKAENIKKKIFGKEKKFYKDLIISDDEIIVKTKEGLQILNELLEENII